MVTVPPDETPSVMVTVVLFVPPDVSVRLVRARVTVTPDGEATVRVTLPLK
jgi:hypothetical protein